MVDYVLRRDENGMVRYLYGKDRKYPYVGETKWESARWMLENDKRREIRMSEEFEGFPLTADGVYFFDGCLGEGDGEATSSGAEAQGEGVGTSSVSAEGAATFPRGEGFGETEEVAPGCGPDWCEIPELAEKPKRRKRCKDVVCE